MHDIRNTGTMFLNKCVTLENVCVFFRVLLSKNLKRKEINAENEKWWEFM